MRLSELTNKIQIITEGGNIFKDENKVPVTSRINLADVDPTLEWLEQIVGLDLRNNKLGSTGIKSSSGDLDIAIDDEKVDKNELYNILKLWAEHNHPEDDFTKWVRKSGISVHFKTPIDGDEENGFVQTDLMFGKPQWLKFVMRGTGSETSPFKGLHRAILMASIAKGLGLKWSPKFGLVTRDTGDILANEPDHIAEILLGPGSTEADLDTVETIIAKIEKLPNYEDLIHDAKENFAREGLAL